MSKTNLRLLTSLLACASAVWLLGPAQADPPPGYRLDWSEEFHQGVGAKPDPAVWGYNTGGGGWGNGELETYVSDLGHAQIVAAPGTTDGQALQILSTDTHGYESARMITEGKKTFQYGFFEARIKLPYGQGIWPAYWMLGANIGTVGWPASGEVDIMENIGKKSWEGHNLSSLHSAAPDDPHPHANFTKNAPYDLPRGAAFHDDYHLFQMLWAKDSLSFYVDGALYETRTPAEYGKNPWPFNAPCFLILNTAVGGDWPGKPDATTVFPQRMLVDYIRVYQGTPTIPAAPKGLAAEPAEGGQILLSWPGDTAATTYSVYRSTKRGDKDAAPYKTASPPHPTRRPSSPRTSSITTRSPPSTRGGVAPVTRARGDRDGGRGSAPWQKTLAGAGDGRDGGLRCRRGGDRVPRCGRHEQRRGRLPPL